MPGSATKSKFRTRTALGYDSLQLVDFDTVAAIGAGVNGSTTIQTQFALPVSMKFYGAMASYTAINSILGVNFFNAVVGNGTYETANGVVATQTLTVTTPTTGNVLTWSIAIPQSLFYAIGIQPNGFTGSPGIAVQANGPVIFNLSYTVKSTDTTATILATSMVNYMQGVIGLNALLWMNNAAGVITIGAVNCGTQFNAITTTGAGSTGPTTIVFGGATLAGGTNATAITAVGTNDLFEYNGTNVFASQGTPVFGNDQALFAPAPGTTNQLQNLYVPTNFDVIYGAGSILTLRVWSQAGVGSITNLKVVLLGKFIDMVPEKPSYNALVPQLDIL